MPVNSQRVIQIINEELNGVEQRGKDYRKALEDAIAEIINTVRLHRVRKIHVQRIIDDKINSVGLYLYKNSSDSKPKREG